MPLPIVQELRDAIDRGDRDAAQAAIATMREKGQLSGYLRSMMIFPGDAAHLLMHIGLIDPNEMVAGNPLLANAAAHGTFDLAKRGDQRLSQMMLLTMGADPNRHFTPTEYMEHAKPLSVFSLLVSSEIGRTVVNEPALSGLLEDMLASGLTVEGAEGELSRLHEVTLALSPLRMLQINPRAFDDEAFRREIADPKGDPFTGFMDPKNEPFDVAQRVQVEEILGELIQWGADVNRPFPDCPEATCGIENLQLAGKRVVQVLDEYMDFIAWGLEEPEAMKAWLEKSVGDSWAKPEFDVNPERLRCALGFYRDLREHVKETHLLYNGYEGRSAGVRML